jgi:hypothetical protein
VLLCCVLQLGLSLSGLEVTAEPQFFLQMMAFIRANRDRFDELCVYSNVSGFASDSKVDGYPLLRSFADSGFDRIEVARHHFDESVNQKIMRFEARQSVRLNAVYEWVMREQLAAHNAVRCLKNACLLTRTGVADIEAVEQYVRWARSLGVAEVVFRELSRLPSDAYEANATRRWVDANRVPIEPLLDAVCTDLKRPRTGWRYLYSTIGFYYANVRVWSLPSPPSPSSLLGVCC